MSDYVPQPEIYGAITIAVAGNDGDFPAFTLSEERDIEGWQPTLIDANTSVAALTIQLRTEPLGVGILIATAQFAQGSTVPTTLTATFPLTLPAGTTVYLRITGVGADAGGLSGVIVLNSLGASFTSGVTQQLTTAEIVGQYDPATLGMDQDAVTRVISSVSDRMVRWMARQINQIVGYTEYHRFPVASPFLALDQYPAANVVITEGLTVVDTDGYRTAEETGVVTRISGTIPIDFQDLNITAVYDAGYAEVPDTLVGGATWQVCAELHRMDDRLIGITQRDPEAGATLTFDADGFLASTKESMRPFRRMTS